MTNTSATLEATGIADAINTDDGPFVSMRNKLLAFDQSTRLQQMKAVAGQPDFSLGSVHAVTHGGPLVIASASGSQLASYAWGAAHAIFVVGAQKLVPTLEDARAFAAHRQNSRVGKLLEIHYENPGRVHVVIIRQVIGF